MEDDTEDHTVKILYRKLKKKIIPERKLRGLSPNFYIHLSVSDLYVYCIFPGSVCLFGCSKIGELILGHRCMNKETGNKAEQFDF